MEGAQIVSAQQSVSCLLSSRERPNNCGSREYHGTRLSKEVIMSDYRRARKRIEVTVGESVRIIRELQELSQNQLSELTGIPQSTISAIERDRVNLGVERAKVLARALKVHPAVLVFPNWDIKSESAA